MGETLCMAARKGETGKLRGYKMAGADLNTKNMSQNTPLHMAAETGQVMQIHKTPLVLE